MRLRLTVAAGVVLSGPFLIHPVQAGLQFNFSADSGTPQTVVDAFQVAANRWSRKLSDNMVVNIQIGLEPLGEDILGEAGSSLFLDSFSSIRSALVSKARTALDKTAVAHLPQELKFVTNLTVENPNGPGSATPYVDDNHSFNNNVSYFTSANGKALGLIDPQSPDLDGVIRFSSDFKFDFDPSNGIEADAIDFVGVATHEIGHVLGWESGVDFIDTFSSDFPGEIPFEDQVAWATPLDWFRFSERSVQIEPGLRDLAADPERKYFSVDGGKTALTYFSTGELHGDGWQASHLELQPGEIQLGIMAPAVAFGANPRLTYNDIAPLDAIGYTAVPEASSVLGGAFFGCAVVWAGRRRRHEVCAP